MLARYRRKVLLGTSIPLAVSTCFYVLRDYQRIPWRLLPVLQLAIWLPIVLLLGVIYVGVQLRFDDKP